MFDIVFCLSLQVIAAVHLATPPSKASVSLSPGNKTSTQKLRKLSKSEAMPFMKNDFAGGDCFCSLEDAGKSKNHQPGQMRYVSMGSVNLEPGLQFCDQMNNLEITKDARRFRLSRCMKLGSRGLSKKAPHPTSQIYKGRSPSQQRPQRTPLK